MGNQISSSSSILPISFASIVVGLVSFVFTLATALRVFWASLRTITSANDDVQDFLPNLKQAIYEERSHLRLLRRRCKAQFEEAAFRVLAEAIRHMITEFKRLEEPFVEDSRPSQQRRSAHNKHTNGRTEIKRDRDHGLEWGFAESSDDYYLFNYGAKNLRQRFLWLKRRNRFAALSERLSRIQTRRMARQQADLAIDARYLASVMSDVQDRLDEIERRLPKGLGMRRTDYTKD